MIKIFVEGTTDVKLLEDFISFTYEKPIIENLFEITGGYGNLFNQKNLNQLRFVEDQGGVNLVMFDSNGSFSDRKNELLDKATLPSIGIELFLFPNNSDSGDRETLLQNIATPDKYNPFFTCFDAYMSCLLAYNEQYMEADNSALRSLPDRKIAINNYLLIHGGETREKKRDYTNSAF